MALCRAHHEEVDRYSSASGLLIQGYVYRDGPYIVYEGSNWYLLSKYGKDRKYEVH